MAISLSSLAASRLAASQASQRGGVDPAARALQKGDQRIQPPRELVTVSSFGKAKSAVADVRSAAAALSDGKAFDAALSADSGAVRSALSGVGQRVEPTSGSQLADGGNVGRVANALGERAGNLETRQADQQALAAARQTVSAQANRFNESLNSGAAAYQRVFSL
jgi:hypothetical protein